MPLYRYLGGTSARTLPVPMMNILNGGKHADSGVDLQEFMVMPVGAETFSARVANGRRDLSLAQEGAARSRSCRLRLAMKAVLRPTSPAPKMRLALLCKPSKEAGYKPGEQVMLAMDPAMSELYNRQ